MKLIVDKEMEKTKGNEEDIKLIEEKTNPLIRKTQMMRLPIYFSIPLMIWESPLTFKYHGYNLFSNYYLIFMTCIEGCQLFSLGINQYNLNNRNTNSEDDEKEFQIIKNSIMRKRLFMMIFFFTGLIISAKLASEYKTSQSLFLLCLANIYLYIKFSYHITLYGLKKNVFDKRMKNCGMNLLLILFTFIITNRKNIFVSNNLIYNN